MNEELSQTIEENMENLPEEVSDFIFGDGLDKATNEIETFLENDAQKTLVRNDVFFYLLGITSADELNRNIEGLQIVEGKKTAIKKIIQEKIIDEVLLLIQVHSEMESASRTIAAPTTPIATTNSSTTLNALTARLTQNKTVAPTKRDLSLDSTPASAPMGPSTPAKPSIDPYRELPEK